MATSLPCLVLNYGDKRPMKLYGASDGEFRPCEIGPLLTKRNWATAQGWVLAWDPDTSATFLWDPQDPEHGRVQLPSLAQAPPLGSECALSGDPAGPGGCTVVLAEPCESTVIWYCHAGSTTAEWVRHEYDLGGRWAVLGEYREWIKEHISGLVACGGKFYYPVSDKDECGVLEFSPEPVFSTVTTKGVKLTLPPSGEVCVHWNHFLFDLDGELHALCIFFAGLDTNEVADIAVYKMDFAGSRCAKVDNIGDRAILASASNHAVGWCSASKFGLLPNSVYWMSRYDKCLHVYDIETSTEELRVCEDVAKLSRQPFWLIPTHHP
ncbi:hypothetical protein CFC21_094193 [Triticum aestivum]|uniref:KIB1-4 beta-propeller domain-containing protein n=3 Tax=Triticinae TaxID=1648030 RepID=A0A9R1LMM8_WHEAT|nr:hypothetical protein CFC21_094193 [Triticum aestivum]